MFFSFEPCEAKNDKIFQHESAFKSTHWTLKNWVPQAKADSRWRSERHRRNFHIYIVQHLHQPARLPRMGSPSEFWHLFWGELHDGSFLRNGRIPLEESSSSSSSFEMKTVEVPVQCSLYLYGWVIFQEKQLYTTNKQKRALFKTSRQKKPKNYIQSHVVIPSLFNQCLKKIHRGKFLGLVDHNHHQLATGWSFQCILRCFWGK